MTNLRGDPGIERKYAFEQELLDIHSQLDDLAEMIPALIELKDILGAKKKKLLKNGRLDSVI